MTYTYAWIVGCGTAPSNISKGRTFHAKAKMGEIKGISNYRKFIFSLSEALTKRDLASLTYLLCDTLTAREIENINDPKDLFGNLERRCMLGPDNFHILEDLFAEIHRQDLVKKVKDFQRKQTTERGFVSSNETQLTDQRTLSCRRDPSIVFKVTF